MNENLGDFWECLSGIDQKKWFAMELHHQDKLRQRTLSAEQLRALGQSRRKDKLINSLCNYHILENQKYADMFFYTPIDRREDL